MKKNFTTLFQKNIAAWKRLKISAGFPVAQDSAEIIGGDRSPQKNKHGIALIIAVVVIAMMMVFSSDLILTSQVNLELAVSHRDSIKSEYMAKSGVNLGLFMLAADFAIDLFLASPVSPMKTDPADGFGDLWGMLNGIPLGGGSADLLAASQESLGLTSINDSKIVEGLKLFDGEFGVDVQDESNKINVNYCAIGRCPEVIAMMKSLMSCPVEKHYLDQRNVKPSEVIYKMKDWIDSDKRAEPETMVNDEDDPYQKIMPPYRAKNAPFDSLDELRLVDGWTDELHTIFAPYLTVFPYQKSGNDKARININTAPRELLSCLIPSSVRDCNEKFQLSMRDRGADKNNLATSAASIQSTLKQVFCYDPSSEEPTAGGQTKENRTTWFNTVSTVFRLTGVGSANGKMRQLTVIVERDMPDSSKKFAPSYRILYWKMI